MNSLNLDEQLQHVISETYFDFLGERYQGKVRDNYTDGAVRYLITSDRLSCFDVVVTTIPFKGQTLNQMAASWFKMSEHIVKNHIIDVPDPNVMVGQLCEILPVEVVVRAYLAGSAWRDYEAGKAVSGVKFPAGMKSAQKLPEITLTPSTKAKHGEHDMPISDAEVLSQRLVEPKLWQEAKAAALELFKLGMKRADAQGLILVDTKYEFGILNGKLILADEIHTMDSSRYWIKETYQDRFNKGEPPQMLDKEPTRQWLLAQGYKGDGPIPKFSDEKRIEIATHYINSYELITGNAFSAEVGPAVTRIETNLRKFKESLK